MSFFLERFGDLALPLIEAEQDIGAIGTRIRLFDLPGGGAFDSYGIDVAPRGQYTLTATGEIGNLTTQALMLVEFDALRAKRGRREKLYARMDGESVRWTWARLRDVSIRRGMDHVLFLPLSLSFDVLSPVWYGDRHGAGWTFDSGEFFDTGLVFDEATGDTWTILWSGATAGTFVNAGTARIDNLILLMTANVLAALTSFSMRVYDPDGTAVSFLRFAGTIAAGETLTIDCGAQSATIATTLTVAAAYLATSLTAANTLGWVVGRWVEIGLANGAIHRTTIATLPDSTHLTITDALPSAAWIGAAVVMSAYPDLFFDPGHRTPEWIRLEPGSNAFDTFNVASTADPTLTAVFSDGYE